MEESALSEVIEEIFPIGQNGEMEINQDDQIVGSGRLENSMEQLIAEGV